MAGLIICRRQFLQFRSLFNVCSEIQSGLSVKHRNQANKLRLFYRCLSGTDVPSTTVTVSPSSTGTSSVKTPPPGSKVESKLPELDEKALAQTQRSSSRSDASSPGKASDVSTGPSHSISSAAGSPHAGDVKSESAVASKRPVPSSPPSSPIQKSSIAVRIDTSTQDRERFIPITRRSLIRQIMQQDDLLTDKERKIFEDFALALDTAIVNRYHGILQELKTLFEPINPDKDTIHTRSMTDREKRDSEFWLLQRLAKVMEKANFYMLPRAHVAEALGEREVLKGVRVSVDQSTYDILQFWALGRETPAAVVEHWIKRIINSLRRRKNTAPPVEYYKRVVVALRLKGEEKLLLKAFKEIPVGQLEMLLPDGKVTMTKLDQSILATMGAIAGTSVVVKVITWLIGMHVDWTLLITGVTVVAGVQSWALIKEKQNSYLTDLSRMLYFKNIANNRGLLALLVDRAEDESFKQALLVYIFLLANRPPSARIRDSDTILPSELGGQTSSQLDRAIESWVQEKAAGVNVRFDSSEAVRLLEDFGILMGDKEDSLHVLPLSAAYRNLPQQRSSLIARQMDADLAEGYDREAFIETEDEYKEEDKKKRRFGWRFLGY